MSVAPESSAVVDPGGAALIKVGVSVLQRAAPRGMAIVRSWLHGKALLIVGQARAGKSTFIDYLQYGLFEDEKETAKTLSVAQTARFNVKMGRDAALELTVKGIVEAPGQIGPVAHADEAYERRPHAIIVFLDLTTPLEGEPDRAAAGWMTEFCRRLEARWSLKGRRRNRLRTIVIVLNKADKVTAELANSYKQTIKRIVNSELKDAKGRLLDDIAVASCVMVTNMNGTKSADSIIAHVAKALAKK